MNYEDYMLHYGVKGMKWGVRRNRNRPGEADASEKKPGIVKQTLKSMKRERQWKKSLNNLDSMSNSEINKLANRIRLENELKRLSKNSQAATHDDKISYLYRDKLSDAELAYRVNRLIAKDNLTRSVSYATKEQREVGKRFIAVAGSLALRYAMNGTISTKDIGMLILNPPKNINDLKFNAMNNILNKHRNKKRYERY